MYGGTKEEMERLIKDASKMKDVQKELNVSVKKGNMSFGNIVNAISVMQKSMGIAGTSAKEAATTIEGSTNMMKASWDNLVTGIADDNADFDKLVDVFVDSVGTMFDNLLPRIITSLEGVGELIPKLMEILNEHLPELIEGLQNILNSLMVSIIEILPQMAPFITQIILTIVQLLTDNLPSIFETGVQILFTLMEGIANALPDLVPQIVNVIIKIMEIFNENFDNFLMLGVKIILGLIEGLIKSIPDILKNLPTIIMAIINFFTLSKFLSMGKTIIKGIWSGLSQGLPELIKKIPKLIGKIINAFKGGIGGIKDIGKNLVTGLWNGINNAKDWVLGKIKGFGKSILKGLKSFFGIHSPSKLFRDEIGKNLILGVGVAFEKDDNLIDKQINDFGDDVYKKMQGAVNMETGKMAFSGTTGSISQILSSNATFDGNFVVKAEVQEGTLFEANQRITKEKRLQTGFGG